MGMPRKSDRPTREDLIKAEQEIGENIPEELVGMDDGDVRPEGSDEAEKEKTISRH
jgi:hypothetical protein